MSLFNSSTCTTRFSSPERPAYCLPLSLRNQPGITIDQDAKKFSHMYDVDSFDAYFDTRHGKTWQPGATLNFEALQEIMALDIQKDMTKFTKRTMEWHSTLCKILADHFQILSFSTMQLPLVPLRGGSWVSPNFKGKLYYGTCSTGEKIPDGLHANIIDDVAGKDPQRASFYALFGCQKASPAQIADLILQTHRELAKSGTLGYDTSLLQEHVNFVYTHQSSVRNLSSLRDLLVACSPIHNRSQTEYMPAARVLLDRPRVFDASKYCKDVYLFEDFWHQDRWLSETDLEWLPWLRAIGIRSHPPLLRKDSSGLTLSEVFNDLLRSEPQSLANLLLDNYKLYEDSLNNIKVDAPHAYEALSNMELACDDGKVRPLHKCYRLSEALLKHKLDGFEGSSFLPYLSSSIDLNWTALEQIGLKGEIDVDFYVEWLKAAKESGICTERETTQIYRMLSRCILTKAQIERLRHQFKEERLVVDYKYYGDDEPPKWRPTWFKPSEVIIDSTFRFEHTTVLRIQDKDIESFFASALQVRNLSLNDFIVEITTHVLPKETNQSSNLARISEDLNKFLLSFWVGQVDELEEVKLIPMFEIEAPRPPDDLTNSSNSSQVAWLSLSNEWYIADTDHLFKTFRGYLPVCKPESPQLELADTLIDLLQLNSRHLSLLMESDCEVQGSMFETLTEPIRRKAPQILRLFAPHEFNVTLRIVNQLRAFRCQRIINKPYVRTQNEIVRGVEGDTDLWSGWTEDGTLEIYFSSNGDVEHYSTTFSKLADVLADELEVDKDVDRILLRHIISETSIYELENLLDENGVRMLTVAETAQLLSRQPAIEALPAIEAPLNENLERLTLTSASGESSSGLRRRPKVKLPPNDKVDNTEMPEAPSSAQVEVSSDASNASTAAGLGSLEPSQLGKEEAEVKCEKSEGPES